MPDFKSIKELEKYLLTKVSSTLKNEVAETVVKTMQNKIDEEVYSVYDPKVYERTGGLLRDIDVEVIADDTIAVENVRFENGRDIAEIVESGQGYQYNFPYAGVPRPFIESTREELRDTNKLQQAMKKGLKKHGINVN